MQSLYPSLFAKRFGQLNKVECSANILKPNLKKMKIKTQLSLKKAFAFLMIFCTSTLFAQMSHEEYKETYKPHYEKLTPTAKLVTTVNNSEISVGAAVIQLRLKSL